MSGSDASWLEQHASTRVEFAWTEKVEYGDHVTIEWTLQRELLLNEFLPKFATWREQHYREPYCNRGYAEMEITEHGVVANETWF
jgi:hypothetical protein